MFECLFISMNDIDFFSLHQSCIYPTDYIFKEDSISSLKSLACRCTKWPSLMLCFSWGQLWWTADMFPIQWLYVIWFFSQYHLLCYWRSNKRRNFQSSLPFDHSSSIWNLPPPPSWSGKELSLSGGALRRLCWRQRLHFKVSLTHNW